MGDTRPVGVMDAVPDMPVVGVCGRRGEHERRGGQERSDRDANGAPVCEFSIRHAIDAPRSYTRQPPEGPPTDTLRDVMATQLRRG